MRSTAASDRNVEAGREPARRPIRVLWLIKGLGRGGAEMLLYHAARLRDRDSFSVELGYLLGSRSWLAEDFRAEGVPVHLFASERHADLRWAVKLRRHLRKEPVDVVHVHSPLVAAVARLVVRTLPRRVRPRTVSTEHLPWSGHARSTRLANRATFRLDEAHLAVSSAVLDSIPHHLRDDVRVLVHGIPVEHIRAERRFRETVRAELGVAPDEVLICTVANYTAQKGFPILLAAARKVLDRGRKVRFVVAGRGTQDDEMHAMSERLGLGSGLLLAGAVEDAPRFMAGCDVFALSSHWEGLPLVLMEAMAVGLPVVATNVGGIPELVRDGVDGILVPSGDPGRLAEAIDRLVADRKLREAMARNATEGAPRFDNSAAVRSIEALYREVAGKRNGFGGKANN